MMPDLMILVALPQILCVLVPIVRVLSLIGPTAFDVTFLLTFAAIN